MLVLLPFVKAIKDGCGVKGTEPLVVWDLKWVGWAPDAFPRKAWEKQPQPQVQSLQAGLGPSTQRTVEGGSKAQGSPGFAPAYGQGSSACEDQQAGFGHTCSFTYCLDCSQVTKLSRGPRLYGLRSSRTDQPFTGKVFSHFSGAHAVIDTGTGQSNLASFSKLAGSA